MIIRFNLPCLNLGALGGAVSWGTALQAGRSRLRFPMVSLEIFHCHNPSGRTMAPGSTQPLTEMSTRNISWGVKAAGAYGWQPYHLHVPIVLKSGSLNLLEPSGPVQACNGGLLYCFNLTNVEVIYFIKRVVSSDISDQYCICVVSFFLYLEIGVMMATKQSRNTLLVY